MCLIIPRLSETLASDTGMQDKHTQVVKMHVEDGDAILACKFSIYIYLYHRLIEIHYALQMMADKIDEIWRFSILVAYFLEIDMLFV